jgi:hypothetical protein
MDLMVSDQHAIFRRFPDSHRFTRSLPLPVLTVSKNEAKPSNALLPATISACFAAENHTGVLSKATPHVGLPADAGGRFLV